MPHEVSGAFESNAFFFAPNAPLSGEGLVGHLLSTLKPNADPHLVEATNEETVNKNKTEIPVLNLSF